MTTVDRESGNREGDPGGDRDDADRGGHQDSWRRKVESSIGNVLGDAAKLKGLLTEMRLPREIVNYIFSQIDETKHSALAVVAKETREFLEHTDMADEIARLLTKVSLRVDVRFVANEDHEERDRRRE